MQESQESWLPTENFDVKLFLSQAHAEMASPMLLTFHGQKTVHQWAENFGQGAIPLCSCGSLQRCSKAPAQVGSALHIANESALQALQAGAQELQQAWAYDYRLMEWCSCKRLESLRAELASACMEAHHKAHCTHRADMWQEGFGRLDG